MYKYAEKGVRDNIMEQSRITNTAALNRPDAIKTAWEPKAGGTDDEKGDFG